MLNVKLANKKIENIEGVNHLLIEVEGKKNTKKIEKPVAIITINDVSGSMSSFAEENSQGHVNGIAMFNNFEEVGKGLNEIKEVPLTKLDYLKIANKNLIDELKEEDMFGVVTFGSYGEVEFELQKMSKTNKKEAKRTIENITTNGMTNLSEGLELAYKMITKEITEKYEVKFLLISDGEANIGIIDKQGISEFIKIKEKEIPVTTIGVGVSYNADFMSSIAVATGSMFYHMKGVAMLQSIFETELKEMNLVNMKGAKVRIEKAEKVDVKVKENLNGFESQGRQIKLGNVVSKQQIVIEINTDECEIGKEEITIILEYRDFEGNKKEEKIKKIIEIVEDGEVDYEENDKEVLEIVKELLDAKKKREVLTYYEKGDMLSVKNAFANTTNEIGKLSAMYNVDLDVNDATFDTSITNQSLSAKEVKEVYSSTFAKTRNRNK